MTQKPLRTLWFTFANFAVNILPQGTQSSFAKNAGIVYIQCYITQKKSRATASKSYTKKKALTSSNSSFQAFGSAFCQTI